MNNTMSSIELIDNLSLDEAITSLNNIINNFNSLVLSIEETYKTFNTSINTIDKAIRISEHYINTDICCASLIAFENNYPTLVNTIITTLNHNINKLYLSHNCLLAMKELNEFMSVDEVE